jgi:glutathione synthase/RimK-type ligase-like ATP-grasp enzyme
MKRCAFLTLDQRGDFVIDDECAVQPLADLGWQVDIVSWRQVKVPWSSYDAVIIRSTWDYWDDVPNFIRVLEEIDASTRLANPLQLVHWNLAKTYLRDLEQSGVAIVPTLWSESLGPSSVPGFCDRLACDEIVIKPVVGANGVDAFRLTRYFHTAELAEIVPRFRDRAMLVQRFMPLVLSEGEYSLFFFSGVFSHAILKVPMSGEFRSQEERGAAIHSVVPEKRLLAAGEQAMAALPLMPLYARIDFVRGEEGDFRVMECELIEPSLYLRTDPAAPVRFARAVNDWFALPGQ